MINKHMEYIYVYETTNLINGKRYIGWHKTHDLEDGYLGSGKILQYAIKKHGTENFYVDILEFFDDMQSAKDYEKKLITTAIVESDRYYNIMPGGQGGDSAGLLSRNYGRPKSALHKASLSACRYGKYLGENNHFYGKTHTPETKRQIADAQRGEKSAKYDNNEYSYHNHITGEYFTGTQYQFRNKYKLDSGNVNKLIKGIVVSYQQWTLDGNNVLARGPKKGTPVNSTMNSIYTIQRDDEIFTGLRHEIAIKIGTRHVTPFLQGKTKTCHHWKIIKKT
jgi:group I intron endonuclease